MKNRNRLAFEKCDRKGIPLSEIIAAHAQFRDEKSLPENLGDGFLFAQNPIFRNIREEFLRRGFTFTLEDELNYFAFPLMCLDESIAAGKIPYRKNFAWLEVLEKRLPGKFTLTELKRSELTFNYLLHESAHFIAHAIFFGPVKLDDVPKNADSLLKILVGEAFANTVEALSSIFAQGEIASYFLDANCYFRTNAREVGILEKTFRKYGIEATARGILAAFLYSNFLYEKLDTKQIASIQKFSGLPDTKTAESLARIGMTLSEQFRTTTTHLHLMKIDFPEDLEPWMQADPVEKLLSHKNSGLKKSVRELFHTLALMPHSQIVNKKC